MTVTGIEPRRQGLATTLLDYSDVAHTHQRAREPMHLASKVRACVKEALRRVVIARQQMATKETSGGQAVTGPSVGCAIGLVEGPTTGHLAMQGENRTRLPYLMKTSLVHSWHFSC